MAYSCRFKYSASTCLSTTEYKHPTRKKLIENRMIFSRYSMMKELHHEIPFRELERHSNNTDLNEFPQRKSIIIMRERYDA